MNIFFFGEHNFQYTFHCLYTTITLISAIQNTKIEIRINQCFNSQFFFLNESWTSYFRNDNGTQLAKDDNENYDKTEKRMSNK